jgi:hypothetical protein
MSSFCGSAGRQTVRLAVTAARTAERILGSAECCGRRVLRWPVISTAQHVHQGPCTLATPLSPDSREEAPTMPMPASDAAMPQ